MEDDDTATPDTVHDRGADRGLGDIATQEQSTRSSNVAVATTTTALPSSVNVAAGASHTRYRLDTLLGRGGMGEVVSARDHHIGRSVAIKRLRSKQPSPDTVARFLREARIQARLEHPAVVPVYELWHDEEGQPFFVMKHLTGTTLADVLLKLSKGESEISKSFPRQRLLRAIVDVCLAVAFAHKHGIVHRDLKPANIMLGDFGEVYVLDWGIARVVEDDSGRPSFGDIDAVENSTMAGALIGTPGYMAPEQIRGQGDVDGRADVYALGCILFEILALEPLFSRGVAALSDALAGVETRPSLRAPMGDVPPELDVVCQRATAPEPGDRFESARQLGDAIQQFLDGDRDLALRNELAKTALAEARTALATGNTASARAVAIRAAGRALALDPKAHEPAEFVGRLMLEPPIEVPREVEAEIAAVDTAALGKIGRLAATSMLGYLAFMPVLWVIGFRDLFYLVAVLGLTAFNAWSAWMLWKRRLPRYAYLAIAGNLLLIALFSRILTPFLVAPGLGAVTIIAIATHPTLVRTPVIWGGICGAILIPWLLELAGVLTATSTVVGNSLVLTTSATNVKPWALSALALWILVVMAVATALTRAIATNQRAARRTLQIQSWQLRQLMPSTVASLEVS